VASLAHCLGYDFDPIICIAEKPQEGVASEGTLTFDEGSGKFTGKMWDLMINYGRSKLGDICAAVRYMAKKYPEMNFTAVHPGSINSNFSVLMWEVSEVFRIIFYGLYSSYVPSQGAICTV
jgi:hypothetical protein